MKFKFVIFFYLLALLSCSNDDTVTPLNQFTDTRDGQVYKTVTIGSQTWFAENLNFDTGDDESTCYQDEAENCFIYGKLYTGNAAQTACPDGWHLPSQEEWNTLIDYLGGINAAHVFLKPLAAQQGELVGFDLLSGGWYFSEFNDIGEKGYYYTSTSGGFPNSYLQVRIEPNVLVSTTGTVSTSIMQSCRCVKD